MKKILRRASAAAMALAIMMSASVFDVTGTIAADDAATAKGGCYRDHSDSTPDTMWTGAAFSKDSNYYYLNNDVQLSENIKITGTVTLCLNGHNITAASGSRIFTVKKGGSLTICDCTGEGIITGGAPTRDDSDKDDKRDYGGAVYVEGGDFTLSGGTISHNDAIQGGGVYVRKGAKFEMSGGIIYKNISKEGSGVYNEGTFIMNGGWIMGNTAEHQGGGVYVQKGAKFEMSDGTLSGNTAEYGDDTTYGGCGVYTAGTFKMSGKSKISGNTAGSLKDGNVG